ncbi:MAG: phosphoenolpyruvate carboxykinase (ATP) [Desulfohalobiaceae bacterium]|nr:phosphoenolpyruvate carboxykinase (ATP) [Desulfohalobiaceae bacterium]
MKEQLLEIGLTNLQEIHHNPTTPALYEQTIIRGEAQLAHLGPLVVHTGKYTGRSPEDRFIVREESSRDNIWWGQQNKSMEPEQFEHLLTKVLGYMEGKPVFVQDCHAGADREFQVPLRVITENAWHSLFARNMFIQIPEQSRLQDHVPRLTVIHAPNCQAVPGIDGTHSEAFVLLHLGRGLIVIGGTSYGGEIKKAVFTAMNYLLPQQSVVSMHCSANLGRDNDTALFFGLSGTGKTTLSTVKDRRLIGDDEHGWCERGVFNIEGGCYAKVIRLSSEAEPEIYDCTRKFATILENVALDPVSRRLDLDNDSLTENTRAAYPLTHIPSGLSKGINPHPSNLFMLSADAFGILPPISKLTTEQAMYHFLSGYTAKLAGTERGITEPVAVFSTCFGAPFMPLHPHVYADLLGNRIVEHDVDCWLVNTGWSGGPYGVGDRISIGHTRAMIRAALSGELNRVDYRQDELFGLHMPRRCPQVPSRILDPKNTWQDPEAYDRKGRELAELFRDNFRRFASEVSDAVRDAGPSGAHFV